MGRRPRNVQKTIETVKKEVKIQEKPQDMEDIGINCPTCNNKMRVAYTRPIEDRSIKRVRVCDVCRMKKPTIEK